ncbi:MAG: alpha/beta hydrolase [bacterium]|nr:alpha/beta hydrolase [bacterium]
MPRIVIDNINIHYRDRGSSKKPVLLLIHGLGCSLKYWDCVFDAGELSHYRILAVDLPGFGLSEKPERYDYQLPSQGRLVFELLHALQIREFSLVGHSMGGAIAILMALQQPQLIRKLLVIEPNLLASHAQLSRQIVEYTEAAFIKRYEEFRLSAIDTVKYWFVNLQQRDLDEYIGELLKTTAVSMYRSANSLLSETSEPGLAHVFRQMSIPRHFLIGEETTKVKPVPEEFRNGGVNTVVVPGVGHMMMVDNPSLFTQTLALALQ